jgi:hypothetical protein
VQNATENKGENLDLIWGAEAIATALNLKSRRQAFHMLEQGMIPARKVGKTWVASREALRRHFDTATA